VNATRWSKEEKSWRPQLRAQTTSTNGTEGSSEFEAREGKGISEEKRYDKPFSHPRWHEPLVGEVVGRKVLTEEEQKKVHDDAVAVLKSWGVKLKDEEEPEPDSETRGNKMATEKL